MKKLIYIALAFMVLAGCRSLKPAQTEQKERIETQHEIIEKIRDTTVYLTDSASLQALIRCDSTGKAYLARIEAMQLGRVVKPAVSIENSVLTVDCKVDSAAVYLAWHERFEQVNTDTASFINKQLPVNYFTPWQKAQMWAGRVGVMLLVGFVIYKLKLRKGNQI
ncbi:MAG: hypothetical protein PHU33_15985 [Bacteroidales bacterium]|nr:hypothetical protein [Bacteroidales bacterium]